MRVPEIMPLDLKAELDGPAPPTLLDVREEEELAISHLPVARHIPLHELPERLSELQPEDDIVVLCHHGGRSACATAYLLGNGFHRVRNLVEGIDGWSRLVDPSQPRY